jgi:MFS transporter, ACS family, hexuronate transporter
VGVRWIVLLLIVLAASINYIDRQVLSVLAPVLRQEFGWTNTAYSTLVFAFLLGWALGEIPIGVYMDRVGPRKGYRLIVFCWSVVIGLHSCASGLGQFVALRFLLGFGECGNVSGGMKVISQWFPAQERARAAGYFNGAINIGAVIATPLTVWLVLHVGWRAAFVLPALVGFVWLVPWAVLYQAPHEHPWVSQEELDFIRSKRNTQPASEGTPEMKTPTGLAGLLRYREPWGLMISRFLIGPVWSLYVFWLPEYLKSERKMSLAMIGLLAWIPFVIAFLGNVAGGEFSSFLIRRRHGVLFSRRLALGIAAVLSSTGLWAALTESVAFSFVLICVAVFGLSFWAANYYALISDIFPVELVARVTGFTGIGNGVGGMLYMLATGILIDRFSYLPVFALSTIMPLAALVCLFCLVKRPFCRVE